MKIKTIVISVIVILGLFLLPIGISMITIKSKNKQIKELKQQNINDRLQNYEDDIEQIDTIIPYVSDSVIRSKADSIIRANSF